MPQFQNLEELIDESYEELLSPPRREDDHAGVYGALGVLLLLVMLLLACGAFPYDWNP